MKITTYNKKRELLDDIENKIKSGELQPGEKLLSTKKLADKYKIAIQTAQRLLNELVLAGLLCRKPGKGTFITEKKSYVPGRNVGLIMTCKGDVWGDFTAQLSKKLQEEGINITYIEADSDTQSLLYMSQHPATLQLINTNPCTIITKDSDLAEYLSKNYPKIQIICIGSYIINGSSTHTICPDIYQAGYIGTKHLIEQGRKRICFFKTKSSNTPRTTKVRELQIMCDGYSQAMQEAGLALDIIVDKYNGLNDKNIFLEKIKSSNPIDGIFVNFDFRATELIKLAHDTNLSIPKDLAVVSVLNTPWARLFKLSSIELHYKLIADKCVEIILNPNKEAYSQVYKFKPELIIRESSIISI